MTTDVTTSSDYDVSQNGTGGTAPDVGGTSDSPNNGEGHGGTSNSGSGGGGGGGSGGGGSGGGGFGGGGGHTDH